MKLHQIEENVINTVRGNIFKNISDKNKLEFLKCKKCNGSGLDYNICLIEVNNKTIENKIWDCESYCDECKGIGFILNSDTFINYETFVCYRCEGTGLKSVKNCYYEHIEICDKCEGTGFVDIIRNVLS